MKLKPALLIAALVLLTYSCVKTSLDIESPKFATPVAFSAQTANSITLTWGAKDDITKDEDISYKVVYSLSDNISTETDAEANGTVLLDWTINTLTTNMTSLSMATTYYISVLARDEKGNTAITSGSSSTLCAGKVIFLASVPNGNLGGVSGADTICTAQKPAGFTSSSFKALVVNLTTRQPCFVTGTDNCSTIGTTGRLNWVLGSSTAYCSSDYKKLVGTTNANSYMSVPLPNSLASTTIAVYTGLTNTWGISNNNCAAFSNTGGTSEFGTPNGIVSGTTQTSFISNGSGACTSAGKIYCVEQ